MASSGGVRSWDTVTAILATLSWFSRCEKPAMKFLQTQDCSGRQGKLHSCFMVFHAGMRSTYPPSFTTMQPGYAEQKTSAQVSTRQADSM